MTDIAITAASVLEGANAQLAYGKAGAAITAGQSLYIDAADSNKLKLADCDGAAALRECVGIALMSCAAGQRVTYQKGGEITIGGTVVPGKVYVLSDTAGGIMPVDDLETGDYTSIIGVGKSSTVITLHLFNSGNVN